MTQPKIRAQAILVAAVPLAFLLVLLALSLLVQERSQAAAALEQRTQLTLAHVDAVRQLIIDASRIATAPNAAGSAAQLAAVRSQIAAHLRMLDADVAGERGMLERVSAMRAAANGGMDLLDRYAAQIRMGNLAAARAMAAAPATRSLSLRLDASYVRFVNAERRNELASLTQLRSKEARYQIALIAACLAGILVTLLVSGRFGLRIAERLEQLGENARRLARGETAAPLEGNDEFSHLDTVYRAMMQRIKRERRIASRLQRTLLPQELPSFEGIRVDTAYVPAAHETEVGGDWYDVFSVSERCICISIGDVAGHGLRAATIMASARLAVRTAARIESEPAQIMTHLNRVMCADEPGTLITALIVMLNIEDGSLRYAVAGHPEPLVIRSDGELQFLGGRGLLIGAQENVAYENFDTQLHEGWALLLYTDGLVEVEHDYFAGIDELCAAASEEFASASENIAEAIQQRVLRGRRSDDDAAVLFVGVTRLGVRRAEPGQLKWVLDARDAHSAHRAKRAILWHLGNEIRNKEQLCAVELILGELIGNVARHSPGYAEVAIEEHDSITLLRVADRGRPFRYGGNGESADLFAESGRGLFLVSAMSQDLRIEHTESGNVVTAVLAS